MSPTPILTVELRFEHDVVLARQRTRQLGELLGLDVHEQTRLATAVSEVARNAFEYAEAGRVEFSLAEAEDDRGRAGQSLLVRVRDRGPGITDLQRILDGRYTSTTGMGLGIVGARRLADRFAIESAPEEGTTVTLAKLLPPRVRALTPRDVGHIAERLARLRPESPYEEIQRQNQELGRMLEELRARQDEVERLNRELEETNRGVLALYAELDERAEQLRRASELKTSFLSNMSHELRTPLSSIVNITRVLLDEMDGPLAPEQRKQVTFVRDSALSLRDIVNDLLDIAKIEAGRTTLQLGDFTLAELFGALRGVFRPLLTSPDVVLHFDSPAGIPPLHSDEGKVAQIMRNFISNALKFTERGEVRVSAAVREGDVVALAVRDTGIGIPPEHQERIFEEFAQVDSPLQRRVKGTGLGLSLTRRLAALLGGRIELVSAPGEGSTFTVVLPRVLCTGEGTEEPGAAAGAAHRTPAGADAAGGAPVGAPEARRV